MEKKFFSMLLVLSIVFAFSRAHAADDTIKQFHIDPLPQMTPLRIAYFSGSVHAANNYIATEKGWFRQANLEVELIPFINGPAIMEAKRSWDVGTTGAPGLISGVIGQDVRMIGLAVWDNILDLLVREDHPIYKAGKGHVPGYPEIWGRVGDWRGSQWLLPAGTTMHLVILTTLARLGLTDQDVTISNMDVTSAYTAFKAGQGDGLGVWTTLAIMAQANGYKKVSGIQECGSLMATTVFANQEALDGNRSAVRKYLEVYLAAAHWLDTHRDEGTKLYIQTCEEDGIAISPEAAAITVASTTTPTLAEQIDLAERKVPDPQRPSEQISAMDKIIVDTFDFFASQGRYTPEDRVKLLGGFIDPSVLLELKAEYAKAGKAIK